MTTLQEILHARAGDDKAAGTIDVKAGRVRIIFGDVGAHGRVVLAVDGNAVSILAPSDLYKTPNETADAEAALLRRRMTPDNLQAGGMLAPNAFEVKAALESGGGNLRIEGGKLFAGDKEIPLSALGGALLGGDLSVGQTIARPTSAGGDQGGAIGTINDPGKTGEGEGGEGGEGAGVVDPEAHSKDDLLALAEKEGVELPAKANKADIAAAINAKRAKPADAA